MITKVTTWEGHLGETFVRIIRTKGETLYLNPSDASIDRLAHTLKDKGWEIVPLTALADWHVRGIALPPRTPSPPEEVKMGKVGVLVGNSAGGGALKLVDAGDMRALLYFALLWAKYLLPKGDCLLPQDNADKAGYVRLLRELADEAETHLQLVELAEDLHKHCAYYRCNEMPF